MRHFDIILDNGQFLLRVPETELTKLNIHHKRKLGLIDRLPWLGLVLRYMWAKKHGGCLENPKVYSC
jgi:hypothetical protein